MALSIKNRETEELARELARITGKPITQAVTDELRRGVERARVIAMARPKPNDIAEQLMEIGRQASLLPVLDPRHPDEIMYDENGLPK